MTRYTLIDGIPYNDKGEPTEMPKGKYSITHGESIYIFDDLEEYENFKEQLTSEIKQNALEAPTESKIRYVVVPDWSDLVVVADEKTTLRIGAIFMLFDTEEAKTQYQKKLNTYFEQCVAKHMQRVGEDCSEAYLKSFYS